MARKEINDVLKAYLSAYRELVVSEPVRDRHMRDSVVISLPLHFSGNHRVEVTATRYTPGRFILSDMARTLGELAEGGKAVTSEFRRRAKEIAGFFGVKFKLDHMILESDEQHLGENIQRLAEAAKTIGDAYLLHRTRAVHARQVIDEVRAIFAARELRFETNKKVSGEIDEYQFDLFIPPNGKPGIAVAVIGGQNTKNLAKVWDFNCRDIREKHGDKLLIDLVLDEKDSAPWSRTTQRILKKEADTVAKSGDLSPIEYQLHREKIFA